MKKLNSLLQIFLILMVVLTACAKKATTPLPVYHEPLSFEIFKAYEREPLDTDYVKKVHDTWQNDLKDDEVIKNHTWLVGDYKVFVYLHVYSFFTDTNYYEMLFFTTTQPNKCKEKIHSTITAFKAEFQYTLVKLSKIKTFVNVNNYRPIKNEDEAKGVMIDYLNEYLEIYDTLSYDRYLINELKKYLQEDNYIRDWEDHYVYNKSPGDFGGAIIVNKLTSKLDFLGSSVWMGHGKRYFPSDY
jgi:hypothetical protein